MFEINRSELYYQPVGESEENLEIMRLMRLMGLEALYPKRCLSRCNYTEYIYPYLLRDRKVYAPNEVWSVDITYIPMNKGFMYLTDHY